MNEWGSAILRNSWINMISLVLLVIFVGHGIMEARKTRDVLREILKAINDRK